MLIFSVISICYMCVCRLDESGDHVQSGRGSRDNWGSSETGSAEKS